MSDYLFVILSGIIEGLTEFLPVSSTAHLIFISEFSTYSKFKKDCFEMIIQFAAILAVLILYRQRLVGFFQFHHNEGFNGVRAWKMLLVTTLPILLVGYLLKDIIRPFRVDVATAGLLLGAFIMLAVEKWKPAEKIDSLDEMNISLAFKIGIWQIFSLFYGMSRSAMTISGAMTQGVSRKIAAEFSFIAAVPVMLVVTIHDLKELITNDKESFGGYDFLLFVIGFSVSFFVAYFVVKWFIRWLEFSTLNIFAWYRIITAPIFLGLVYWFNIGEKLWL